MHQSCKCMLSKELADLAAFLKISVERGGGRSKVSDRNDSKIHGSFRKLGGNSSVEVELIIKFPIFTFAWLILCDFWSNCIRSFEGHIEELFGRSSIFIMVSSPPTLSG